MKSHIFLSLQGRCQNRGAAMQSSPSAFFSCLSLCNDCAFQSHHWPPDTNYPALKTLIQKNKNKNQDAHKSGPIKQQIQGSAAGKLYISMYFEAGNCWLFMLLWQKNDKQLILHSLAIKSDAFLQKSSNLLPPPHFSTMTHIKRGLLKNLFWLWYFLKIQLLQRWK